MKGSFKKMFRLGGLGLIAIAASTVYGAGYKLEFQSPSVLGDAGDAAVVEDAGTNWYNAAGLVYLPQQVVMANTYVYQHTVFTGTAFAPSIIAPGFSDFLAYGRSSNFTNTLLPAFHYSYPTCDKRLAFGISVVPAWGLLEDYGEKALVRYNLERIYTKTIDISPSIAYKFSDHIAIGLGPDFHYWSLQDKIHVRTQPLTTGDAISRVATDAWGYGAHIGILVSLNECTRIGLNYRTRMVMDERGYSDFLFERGFGFETGNFKLNTSMPPTTTLSAYHEINPCWAIMGTIAYDQWNVIESLNGKNFMSPLGQVTTVSIPQNYRNTFDFGLGTRFKLTDCLLLRASIKYLQTPTVNATRDVNFPDGEKLGFNFGARYVLNKHVALDALYAHVFTKTRKINVTNVFGANVDGSTRTAIDVFGGQLVWTI